MNDEFKQIQDLVIHLFQDGEQQLGEELAVMDDHEGKKAEITECLQQLRPESKLAS